MGGFGGFFSEFWEFNRSRASFGGIQSDYPVDLRAVVVPRTSGKFLTMCIFHLGFWVFFPFLVFRFRC